MSLFFHKIHEKNIFWNERWAAFLECNVLFISSWMNFVIYYCRTQIFKVCQSFEGYVGYLYILTPSRILFTRHEKAYGGYGHKETNLLHHHSKWRSSSGFSPGAWVNIYRHVSENKTHARYGLSHKEAAGDLTKDEAPQAVIIRRRRTRSRGVGNCSSHSRDHISHRRRPSEAGAWPTCKCYCGHTKPTYARTTYPAGTHAARSRAAPSHTWQCVTTKVAITRLIHTGEARILGRVQSTSHQDGPAVYTHQG